MPANRLGLTIQTTFACHHSVIYIRHFHYNTLGHSTVRGVWRLLLASPVKAAAIAGPPRITGWAWLARCYWRSKKQNISKRKTDILESQRAIFTIQQLWIGQKERKTKPRKGNYTCPLNISSRKTSRSPLLLPRVKAKPSAPRARILIK